MYKVDRRADVWRLWLASGFFLGLMPVVPGSFGALSALAAHLSMLALGWGDTAVRLGCLALAAIVALAHYWLTPWAQAYWHDPDPRHFVLDEVVGYLLVPVLWYLPAASAWPLWVLALAGFAAFRVLDAIKLPGARYIDRHIHTASGVLFDDVVSAAYAATLVSGAVWLAA